ncbi:hypothetical protein H2204_006874 [Knufia peltigerae]|uniref:ER transporter 6TM N-terminal domain-containing protein n=1 Tax=Knufia peltigerae TaxID=1002370 RepID=A0AA38Y2P0_9EURO|nr:hypothetical protein H2204_006874 [Knufia peltigerae]
MQPIHIRQHWRHHVCQRPRISWHSAAVMIKSALPATVAVAAMQSDTWARHFKVLNYLVAIEALLTFCVLPRARFIQTLFLNVLMVCLATAVNLFALWCSIMARSHSATTDDEYNSSASAVCGVFFFLQMYLTNALRSSRPQFQFPCINYCILTIISLTQAGPSFETMQTAKEFMSLQLQAFLTGFGIGAGVSLFIFPHSNREIAITSMYSYFDRLAELLRTYSLIHEDDSKTAGDQGPSRQFEELNKRFIALQKIDVKLKTDLEFGVRDIGIGHLDGEDLGACFEKLHAAYLPLLGLRYTIDSVPDVSTLKQCTCRNTTATTTLIDPGRIHTELFSSSRDLSKTVAGIIEDTKVCLFSSRESIWTLFRSTRNGSCDPEKGSCPRGRISDHRTLVKDLAEKLLLGRQGIQTITAHPRLGICDKCNDRLQELMVVEQQVQFAFWHLSSAVITLLDFVEQTNGKVQQRRVILPSQALLVDWFWKMFTLPGRPNSDLMADPAIDNAVVDDDHRNILNAALYGRRDPLHLKPESWLERFGERVRSIPHMLRSSHSLFGLRAACASMTIGIVAYLRSSRKFYVEQRCLWAIVMTAFAMINSTGHTTFSFAMRILASFIGTAGSYCIWYIADGNPAAVTVLMFLFMAGSFYWFTLNPKHALLALVSAVTPIIGVGYELNVHKLGEDYLRMFSTPAFPLYQIAAYRLANVVAGLLAAYIWTVFPFPVTEGALIQRHIGSCLYLLARYNAMVSETMLVNHPRRNKFRSSDTSPLAEKLKRARIEVVHQVHGVLKEVNGFAAFTGWQVPIGGRFPTEDYRECIVLLERLTVQLTLQGFALSVYHEHHLHHSDTRVKASMETVVSWTQKQREKALVSHHKVTSALFILSASITNGLPLPPYFFDDIFVDSKKHQHSYLKSVRNMWPPPQSPAGVDGFRPCVDVDVDELAAVRALVAFHVASERVHRDIKLLVQRIKTLCGELNFSLDRLELTP